MEQLIHQSHQLHTNLVDVSLPQSSNGGEAPTFSNEHQNTKLDSSQLSVLSRVCDAFPELRGLQIDEAKEIGNGIINRTFLVTSSLGKVVLQRVHPVVTELVAEQAALVNEDLTIRGWPVPNYFRTDTGAVILENEYGRFRASTCVGGLAFESVSPDTESLALTLGAFHKDLRDFDFPLGTSIPHFHDTSYWLDQVRQLRQQNSEDLRFEFIADTVLREYENISKDAPNDLGMQNIHGDPGLGNFLYTDEGAAFTMIDPDTYMFGSIYHDIGDLASAICRNEAKQAFSHQSIAQIIESVAVGYERGSGKVLDERDVLWSFSLVSLELTARFLVDSVAEAYFSWDREKYPSAKEHNLQRALDTLTTYEMVRSETGMSSPSELKL